MGKKRTGFFWNIIGSGLSSGQAAVLLIFISRSYSIETAGIISLAYALGNIFFSLGRYGVKNYQATDVNEEFCLRSYIIGRGFSVGGSIIIAVFYLLFQLLLGDYDVYKSVLILEIVVLRLIDAFEDVFLGRLQQIGHFADGAKIMAVRLAIVTLCLSLLLVAKIPIIVSFAIGILLSASLSTVMLLAKKNTIRNGQNTRKSTKKLVSTLMINCLPLCIGTTLAIYVGNIPKYLIDAYLDEKTQAVFGYIMLPVFVVTMLNQFIYVPFVKDLGDLWNNGQYSVLKKRVIRQCVIVFLLAAFVLVAFLFIGLPLLSMIYNIDLSAYKVEFFFLLCGGAFYSISYYLNIPLTTIRKQRFIAIGYALASIISIALGGVFVKFAGMFGVILFYLIINLLMCISFFVLFFALVNKQIAKTIEKVG